MSTLLSSRSWSTHQTLGLGWNTRPGLSCASSPTRLALFRHRELDGRAEPLDVRAKVPHFALGPILVPAKVAHRDVGGGAVDADPASGFEPSHRSSHEDVGERRRKLVAEAEDDLGADRLGL